MQTQGCVRKGLFNNIRVDGYAAIIEEESERAPAIKGLAEGLSEVTFAGDAGKLRLGPSHISAVTEDIPFSSISAKTTVAPYRARSRAVAAPMPEAAPVTIAVLPLKSKFMSNPSGQFSRRTTRYVNGSAHNRFRGPVVAFGMQTV